MLLLLAAWTLLTVCSAPIGAALLEALDAERSIDDPVDYLVLAIWMGLTVTGCGLLALALFLPISAYCGSIPAAVAGFCCMRRQIRSALTRRMARPVMVAAAVIALALSFHGAWVLVDAYDTGLYHQQAIAWLSNFGLVKGLTWLHFRLGWPSSWFALCAVFNHGVTEGRGSAVVGEYAVVVTLIHLVEKLHRLASGRLRAQDAYLLGAYPIALAAAWYWHFDLSSGTDVPGWLLTVLIGWTALTVAGERARARTYLLPLALAALAVACKLTVIPLVPASFVFASAQAGWRRMGSRWMAAAAALVAIPVATLIAANAIVSGCPLYPSTFACLGTSWSIPREMAQYVTDDIRTASRWLGTPESEQHGSRWILLWLTQKEKLAAVALTVVSTAVVLWRARRGPVWVLVFGYAGLAVVAVNAPNLRYGLGFFLLFAGGLACACRRTEHGLMPSARRVFAPAMACLMAAGILVTDARHRLEAAGNPWLLPAALPARQGDFSHIYNRYENRLVPLHFLWREVNGFHFRLTFPVDQCWDLPIPCTPFVLNENFRLADPGRGLAAGFAGIPHARTGPLGPHVAQ